MQSVYIHTAPSAVRDLERTSSTESSLTVTWEVTKGGGISGYLVILLGSGKNESEVKDKDTRSWEWIGLTPGVEYLIRVETIVIGGGQTSHKEYSFNTSKKFKTLYKSVFSILYYCL